MRFATTWAKMSSKRIVDLRAARPLQQLAFFRTPEKRPSLRDRRRKLRFVALTVVIAVLATIAWGVHAFSYLSQLTIQRIEVRGAQKVPPQLVSEYAASVLDDERFHYIARRNIFFYPHRAIADAIAENFPRVASATLVRETLFSTTLVITIAEREPFARWCIDPSDEITSCFFLDTSGFIFAESSDPTELPQSPYLFSGGTRNIEAIDRTFAPGTFAHMLDVLAALEAERYMPVAATLQNDEDFWVSLERGFYIKVSRETAPHVLVRDLELVLGSSTLAGREANLEYIDLRFGNRVYYKLEGQAESSG